MKTREGISFMKFCAVTKVLEEGFSMRIVTWEPITRLFIKDGTTVCQRGDAAPYAYELSWKEIQSKKWQVV
jgi:hypothetical protein